ncbi:adenosylmethionine decarboxylase [Streptomyces swartbergensis]|uniref:Adenosylmethionine decarboxylase n=1 Tax=Streptomyces swartbergensis TaxID=487165 RepID=A0A243RRE5_9ACTN|nr:adenosylmethionine decarboxylase [Streptomyces swartbergensis]OUC97591.1 adenosylmethionine decarboxylase [Streptomyces swartbergensis]
MSEFQFSGRHVVADVYDIAPEAINDASLIMRSLEAGIRRSGATVCGSQMKHFEPSGFTVLYLLSESHVSVHTYPEERSLFFDAFTCGEKCRPELIIEELVAALGDCERHVQILDRGEEPGVTRTDFGVIQLAG